MVLNPETPIVAIVEGSALELKDDNLRLACDNTDSVGYIFKAGAKSTITITDNLNDLL
jgi:dipeptidase E